MTLILHKPNSQYLQEAVLLSVPLVGCEKRLLKDTRLAEVYCIEMQKLEQNEYVAKVPPQDVKNSKDSWYLHHYGDSHNSKVRISHDCSFTRGSH